MYAEINNPLDYKAALYVRLSKEDESRGESESVKNQKSMLFRFVKERGLKTANVYVDDGYSGGNFERPAFKEMIEDIEQKKVNLVITKDLSRLGRDYIQTGYYLEKYFPEKHVRYISLLDGIDTGVESSMNDIGPFKALMNDFYAKDISKKIKSVKRDKMRKGLFIGGKAPYGYKMSEECKNKLFIDDKAAETVKRIFFMAAEGYSARQIAIRLTEEKIKTPSQYANLTKRRTSFSEHWKPEVVSHMLRNQVYIGNMVQGRMKKINYKSKKCVRLPESEWVIVENTHEPIVDKEFFEKIQPILFARRTIKTRTLDYLLKGMILCYDCKTPMGVLPKGNNNYLRCRTYARFPKLRKCEPHMIRADAVENTVVNELIKLIKKYSDKDAMQELVVKEIEVFREKGRQSLKSRDAENELAAIDLWIDKIYADKVREIISEEDFKRMYTVKKEERETLKQRIDSLNNLAHISNEGIAEYIVDDFLQIKKFPKIVLWELIEKIEITEDKKIMMHIKNL